MLPLAPQRWTIRKVGLPLHIIGSTNTNDIREEINRRINMENAYYSLEKILSCRLLSKKLKVKIYETIILPVVLYGCETWSLTLREEHRLSVFENKVLTKIFGPSETKLEENGKVT